MTIAVPIEGQSWSNSHSSSEMPPDRSREVWEGRRRFLERQKAHFGPDGARSLWPSRIFSFGATMLGRGSRLLGFHARGLCNALDVQLRELSLSFSELPPAFDGYRILHLSDTHLDFLPELASIAARLLAGKEVDLLALTGDIHGHYRAPLAASTEPLGEMLGAIHVHDRRLAVLGNHDPADMAAALERLGFEVLLNRSIDLVKQGQCIVVTGLDDVHRFFTPDASRALAETPDEFRIALVHSAEVADQAAAVGYSLYLCGHTHGGQICLPGGRPLITRLRRCHFAAAGEWRLGGMSGYTSRGLGVGDVPLRFNSRGEVTIITLRRSNPKPLPPASQLLDQGGEDVRAMLFK